MEKVIAGSLIIFLLGLIMQRMSTKVSKSTCDAHLQRVNQSHERLESDIKEIKDDVKFIIRQNGWSNGSK